MLNIWGVILYLRLPWITAQAGIGTSEKKIIKFVFFLAGHCLAHSNFLSFSLCFYFRSDLGDYPAILFYNWNHWSLHFSHCYQWQSQRRSVHPLIYAIAHLHANQDIFAFDQPKVIKSVNEGKLNSYIQYFECACMYTQYSKQYLLSKVLLYTNIIIYNVIYLKK